MKKIFFVLTCMALQVVFISQANAVDRSMTEPVKFAEEWTWARPLGTQDWKLEGIKEV